MPEPIESARPTRPTTTDPLPGGSAAADSGDTCAESAESELTSLGEYGWNEDVADAFSPYEDEGLLPARVLRVDRGARCLAITPLGPIRAATHPVAGADQTRAVCTGDWAALELAADGEAVVRALLPRRTAFLRSTASTRSEGQVLAANVDHALIAVSLAAELDLGRVERFVSLAWTSGAQPLVVLTKADLLAAPETEAHLAADVRAVVPGVAVLTVSAETGRGLPELRAAIAGGTTVLLGQSGVGKSTLSNALLGAGPGRAARGPQTVQAIRDGDGKGRHTTSTRDLLPLPAATGGGVLIDTPGLRGVGLWDAEDGVEQSFSEIAALAEECRFQDCQHGDEPGCAVLAAVEDGTLPERRLESYGKLLRENQRLAALADARLRQEQKQAMKRRKAFGRHMMERKRGPGYRA
ncbi:ribosome small subunit-dependent GTPase A [Streptomyces sp. AJS327]|uniref:ribosome small subunit-dependent GTPase A n=1 Tax=Streptomyces sp. AJS327 TaxID=2545265 RepID=UPI0015DEC0AD|nr:ribosome small subunit-dependent GTPase A [Streptomyces sp. AJS327]MBA0052094.1 ribosome small subunit-dependent GTPase A [Streptomyces sp. AJS327]